MDLVKRFEIYLVSLDPTQGSEIKKTRPSVIVSPDEMNEMLKTVIIAPLTSTIKGYPTRVALSFENKLGEIALDQIRTVDRTRLLKKLGKLQLSTSKKVSETLEEMFSY